MTDHTLRAFDTDFQQLIDEIRTMGGLVEKQAEDAMKALSTRDSTLAKSVTASRASVNAMQREIENKVIAIIARRQPMAIDLRQVVGAFRVGEDLEHIGDHADEIAREVLRMNVGFAINDAIMQLKRMMELALEQLSRVLRSYEQGDLSEALEVWRRDEEIDALNNSLFRELLTYMMQDPRHIPFCAHLLFCAKNIERIGDHATNIAETVYRIVQGEPLLEERPKAESIGGAALPLPA
jgi:phosphate transport system protein